LPGGVGVLLSRIAYSGEPLRIVAGQLASTLRSIMSSNPG